MQHSEVRDSDWIQVMLMLLLVNTLDTLFSLVRDLDYETLSRSGIVSEEELEK